MAGKDQVYQINIDGFRLYAYHGVYPEENKLGQTFEIDLLLTVSQPSDMNADELSNVISYWEVMQTVESVFTKTVYKLIETAAHAILESLTAYPEIRHAKVQVKKVAPPIPASVKAVGVIFEREY